MGSIGLIKFIENTFPVLFFDLRAIIFDGNGDRSVFLTLFVRMLPDENRYLSFLRRKFYGVVQKIYPYLLHHFFICLNHMFIEITGNLQLLLAPFFLQQENRTPKLFRKIVFFHAA